MFCQSLLISLKFILNYTYSTDSPCTLKTVSFVANIACAITFPIPEVSANSINTAAAIILLENKIKMFCIQKYLISDDDLIQLFAVILFVNSVTFRQGLTARHL